MSTKKIDYLMELWALDKAKTDSLAPFTSYEHMYSTIDSIEQGDLPWHSFSMSYEASDEAPADTTWKQASYEVWYRDPTQVISMMLDNPDFCGQFDYAPYIESDARGLRVYSDFMSGKFAWRHSVCDVHPRLVLP